LKIIIDAEEVFVNCYNFNPNRVKHASVYVKSTYQYKSKKVPVIFKVYFKNYPELEPEPELQFGLAAP
jgi:hypothetical protein